MESAEFAERLSVLTAWEITELAALLRREHDTAEGEVSWWRATIAIGAGLKRHHRSREAGIEAHRAAGAVQQAAARYEHAVARDDVIVVARAAAEVARLLVADHDHDVAPSTIAVVLAPWRPFVSVAA